MWEKKRNTNFEKCKEKGPHNLETAKKSAPTRTAPWRLLHEKIEMHSFLKKKT